MLFAIGAALNFYIGKIGIPKFKIFGVGFIWLYRIWKEPNKQIKRISPYIKMMPKLYLAERKKINGHD